jgi:hypothetical protein
MINRNSRAFNPFVDRARQPLSDCQTIINTQKPPLRFKKLHLSLSLGMLCAVLAGGKRGVEPEAAGCNLFTTFFLRPVLFFQRPIIFFE